MSNELNLYSKIIAAIFLEHYRPGASEVAFSRSDLIAAAEKLGLSVPKNVGDVIYSFRYRTPLPANVASTAPPGHEWIIRPAGRARYKFALAVGTEITASAMLVETKIPDATPGVISQYALDDEQALLARLRYNRLVDIFTGVTCYSLQNHLRTYVKGIGQVETDELYIGIDKRGAHFVLPVQAKGSKDRIGVIQIEQDFAICADKFPSLPCRLIAAQLIKNGVIALFEFEQSSQGLVISAERHYRLVQPPELTSEELATYQRRPL